MTNNAGATIPVMSSPVPRERTINVTIPNTIKAASVIAEYFTAFRNCAESSFIAHLTIVVAFSLIIATDVSANVQSTKPSNPCSAAARSRQIRNGYMSSGVWTIKELIERATEA